MKLYVDLYKWYYMPSSVHKVIAHGADIIASFGLIPIGKLSEEASESRNKDFRRIRLDHSQKFCRKATNRDILNNLLVSSDPFISTKRTKLERKHRELSDEAKDLLDSTETFDDDLEIENKIVLREDLQQITKHEQFESEAN